MFLSLVVLPQWLTERRPYLARFMISTPLANMSAYTLISAGGAIAFFSTASLFKILFLVDFLRFAMLLFKKLRYGMLL